MNDATRAASRPTRADLTALATLAAPIVVVQVGLMFLGVVDTLMVGRLSATALAAVALANIYFFGIVIFGLGTLLALDPIVAQALGAGDELAARRGVQRGLVLSVAITVPVSGALALAEPVLELARQPAEVIPLAAGYVWRVIAAVWPLYAFVVLRQTLQAQRKMRAIVATIVVGNVANAVLNYAWIFGKLGFPALGVNGSAYATSVSRWLMPVVLLVLAWPHLERYLRPRAPRLFAAGPLARMFVLGAPIGGQMMLEVGAFSAVAVLMGWLGVAAVAAHQIAINLASLTFMVPLGVGSAAAVIVGRAVGRGDHAGLKRASTAALATGAAFMGVTGAIFVGLPGPLAGLYTNATEVIALAVVLLPIAGVFQIFDGLQAVAIGVLRGLGDTRVPLVVNIVGFWAVGLPTSLALGFGLGLGPQGLWWGLVVGLVLVAAFLSLRVAQRLRRTVPRVVIDEPGS